MFKILNADESAQRKLGVILSYANILISTILVLTYTPFFLRMLGESEFGLYSLSASVIGYLAILDLGFGNAITVFSAKYAASGESEKALRLHGTIFSVYLAMSALVLLIGGLVIAYADAIFGAKLSGEEIRKIRIMFALLSLNLAVSFPFSIYSSILTAHENFVFIKLIAILRTLLLPAIAVPVLLLGHKSVAIVVCATAVNLFCVAADFIYCRRKIAPRISVRNFDAGVLKQVFSYSFFIFLGMIVDQVNWSADNFILGVVAGTTAVSQYSVAAMINSTFITLSVTISGVMLPKISKMVSANSSDAELTAEFIKIGRLQFYVIFLICSMLIIFGREFIILWAGAQYEISYTIALILVIPVCVPLIQNLGLSILQAKNKFRFRAVAALFMTFLNIAVSIPLAKLYGGVGSAAGTALSLVLLNIALMNFYYHFKIGLDIAKFWLNIARMLAPSLLAVAIILPINYALSLNGAAYLLVCGSLYVAIFTFIAVKLVMNDYERAIFGAAIAKIRSRS